MNCKCGTNWQIISCCNRYCDKCQLWPVGEWTNWPGGSSPSPPPAPPSAPPPSPAVALSKHSTTKTECPLPALEWLKVDSSPCIVLFDVRPATISLMQDAGRESIELELEIGCKAESQKLFQSLASPSLSDFIRHCIANKVPKSSSWKFPASQFS